MDRPLMITWGLLAGATAFVTGATSFGVLRFLLGAAEVASFGIVLYSLTGSPVTIMLGSYRGF